MRRLQTSGLPVTSFISCSTRFILALSGRPGHALFSPFTSEKCVVGKFPTFWEYHYRVYPLQMAGFFIEVNKKQAKSVLLFLTPRKVLLSKSCFLFISYSNFRAQAVYKLGQECTVELWLGSYISCYISFTELNVSLIIKTRHPALL